MGVSLCLLILQGLVLAVSPKFLRVSNDVGAQGVVASAEGDYCGVQGGEGLPARGDHSHLECCVVCATSCRDALFLVPNAVVVSILDSSLEASDSIDRYFAKVPDCTPTGWTSSWSSRAPPLT
jgi:hypothetical protein